MATITKQIKYPGNELYLEILRYAKDETPRDRKANISLVCGFDFDDRFTPGELEELGWWLIHEAKKRK